MRGGALKGDCDRGRIEVLVFILVMVEKWREVENVDLGFLF